MWSIETDPRLRSTIVTLILLDRSPDWNEVLDRFEFLSRTVPVFRQRVVSSVRPAPPRWEADPDFDLAFHVRRVTAPAPGTLETLLEMARIAAMAGFDRAHPLWEVTLVDGLQDGGAVLLCKLNHALTDGVGAIEMARTLFDRVEALGDRQVPLRQPIWDSSLSAAPGLADVIRHPVRMLTTASSTAVSILRTARPSSRPASPEMRERSTIRRLAVHSIPKESLRRAGNMAGGSLNDAFIAAIAGGLRQYKEKHGMAVADLIAMMPIDIRMPTDPVGGNRATLMRFDLPAIGDPGQRIAVIHDQTSRARNERSLAYTQLIAAALNVAPGRYVRSMLRRVDFIASDVAGFPMPVALAGAVVQAQYAFSPTMGSAVNVTLLSYVDTCAIGINVDARAIPDVDAFHDCLVRGFDEVLRLAN